MSEKQRWWLSWYQKMGDHRPITFPPNEAILGWWCTGSGSGEKGEVDILCALVEANTNDEAWEAVKLDWPDMLVQRFINLRPSDYVIDSSRFPLSDWMKPRMGMTPLIEVKPEFG